jgi:mevalonate pyrophosphate decarboxylase
MLEYGIKTIIINPLLITPASYVHYIKKIEKEIEYKKWVEEKKKKLKNLKQLDNSEDISIIGLSSINDYLENN